MIDLSRTFSSSSSSQITLLRRGAGRPRTLVDLVRSTNLGAGELRCRHGVGELLQVEGGAVRI